MRGHGWGWPSPWRSLVQLQSAAICRRRRVRRVRAAAVCRPPPQKPPQHRAAPAGMRHGGVRPWRPTPRFLRDERAPGGPPPPPPPPPSPPAAARRRRQCCRQVGRAAAERLPSPPGARTVTAPLRYPLSRPPQGSGGPEPRSGQPLPPSPPRPPGRRSAAVGAAGGACVVTERRGVLTSRAREVNTPRRSHASYEAWDGQPALRVPASAFSHAARRRAENAASDPPSSTPFGIVTTFRFVSCERSGVRHGAAKRWQSWIGRRSSADC